MLKKKGFTLIELIVVIAIIGILSAILIPSVVGYIDGARKKATVANGRVIYDAMISTLGTSTEGHDSFYSHSVGHKNVGCSTMFISTAAGKAYCDNNGKAIKYTSLNSAKKSIKYGDDGAYVFTVVTRADGRHHDYGDWDGVSNVYNSWSYADNDYKVFADQLSLQVNRETTFYQKGGHNTDTGKYPIAMPYSKREDGGRYPLIRWLVVYRLDDPETVEVWAGDGTKAENGPVYRVFPNPACNY